MRVNNFKKFNESLGINSEIGNLTDEIIDIFKTEKNFKLSTTLRGINLTINCHFEDKLKGLDPSSLAGIRIINREKGEFELFTSTLERPIILHEIKHIDRSCALISKGLPTSKHGNLKHISEFISNRLGYLFKSIKGGSASKILIDILYYSDQNEFESYFNQFYEELKSIIKPNMTGDEKRKIISDHLNDKIMYKYYWYYSKNNFNIAYYFKTKNGINLFINELYQLLAEFQKDPTNKSGAGIKDRKVVSIYFKNIIFNIKKILGKDAEDIDSRINEINKLVNDSIRKNFKRFGRLYILLGAIPEKSKFIP